MRNLLSIECLLVKSVLSKLYHFLMPDLPDFPLSGLHTLFTDGSWPALSLLIRVLFLLGFAGVLLRVRFHKRDEHGSHPGWPASLTLFTTVFLLLLMVRQADWQLFGQRRPEFVAFMQRYDRREFNPAHRTRAGRILDRRGRVLAVTQITDAGLRRVYRYGPVFSHVVGYSHPLYGLTGLESAARTRLLGGPPRTREELARLPAQLFHREEHTEGPPLHTPLDLDLQLTAHQLMEGHRGAVVLLDIATGDVLVLLSRPEFDPNRLHGRLFSGPSPEAPLLNRALAGQYPPGSVFKTLIAAAALEQGFQGSFDTPPDGFTTAPSNPRIRDHDYYTARRDGRAWQGHGRIGLGEAFAISSNVFFAQLAVQVGATALEEAVRAAGLREVIPLWERPDTTLNLRPARVTELRDTAPYNLAQFSIGQGDLLVSPMHMALLSAQVARGGEFVLPRLDMNAPVRTGARLLAPDKAQTLRWMMHRVVTEGTGRGAIIPELAIAGKTGTAQTGGGRESHSWFTGFAPAGNPRWAFCVMVEHGGYGSRTALPIARELLQTGVREGWLVP